MQIKPFFPVFIVLVGVVIYAYYAPKNRPERAINLTPKEYIELVQKNRAAKLAAEAKIKAEAKAKNEQKSEEIQK
ncbi:MAG: aldehyde dehydrogenase [Sedimenticola sp.]